jgi:hypothetical protein
VRCGAAARAPGDPRPAPRDGRRRPVGDRTADATAHAGTRRAGGAGRGGRGPGGRAGAGSASS